MSKCSEANARRRLKAAKYRQQLKKPGCCLCGYNKHHGAIEFHHTAGKTDNLSSMGSLTKIDKELLKHRVVLLCANCHREVTAKALTVPRNAPRVMPISECSPVKKSRLKVYVGKIWLAISSKCDFTWGGLKRYVSI